VINIRWLSDWSPPIMVDDPRGRKFSSRKREFRLTGPYRIVRAFLGIGGVLWAWYVGISTAIDSDSTCDTSGIDRVRESGFHRLIRFGKLSGSRKRTPEIEASVIGWLSDP